MVFLFWTIFIDLGYIAKLSDFDMNKKTAIVSSFYVTKEQNQRKNINAGDIEKMKRQLEEVHQFLEQL